MATLPSHRRLGLRVPATMKVTVSPTWSVWLPELEVTTGALGEADAAKRDTRSPWAAFEAEVRADANVAHDKLGTLATMKLLSRLALVTAFHSASSEATGNTGLPWAAA